MELTKQILKGLSKNQLIEIILQQQSQLKKLEESAPSQGYQGLPQRIIHGDYCINNLLFTFL